MGPSVGSGPQPHGAWGGLGVLCCCSLRGLGVSAHPACKEGSPCGGSGPRLSSECTVKYA